MDEETVERNKQNVAEFYDLMFNHNRPTEAIDCFAGAEYRQHNPHVADGKQAFIEYFERMASGCSPDTGAGRPGRPMCWF